MAQNNIQKAIAQSQKKAASKSQARGRTYKPAAVSSTKGSARANAKNAALAAEFKKIEVELRKEANKHRFSTKSQIEQKARTEFKAGKIAKGQLTKTIEKRWEAAQKRRAKFQGQQKAKEIKLKKEAQRKISKMSTKRLGVGDVRALVTFQISSDVRQVELTFPGSADSLRADAQEALDEYMHGEGELLSVDVLK